MRWNVWEIEWGSVLLYESVLLCPCGCTVKENGGELVVVLVGEPASSTCGVGTAHVEVSCLMVCVLRGMMKREFDVNCRCVLCASECVGVRCDVMLLKELFPYDAVGSVPSSEKCRWGVGGCGCR